MSAPLEIRRLAFADLPQVVAIERRSFPTPWSLAMFVLELSKASSVCLAARDDGRLVGYLVCSRYDTVWHVMNVAVDPAERRHGVASALLERLWERIGDPEAQYTLEVRPSNAAALALYDRHGFKSAGRAPPLLPGQRRGRRDHVAHARDAGRARRRGRPGVILALETSCDDTCAAVVDARRGDPRQRDLLAGRARGLRGRRARGRLAPPPRAHARRGRRRAGPRARSAGTTSTASPSPRARASSARCSSASRAPRRWPPAASSRSRRSTTCTATWPPTSWPRRRSSRPSCACSPRAGTRCWPASRTPAPTSRSSAARSTTRRARRSTRARGCSGSASPAARRSPPWPARATPSAFTFPTGRGVAGLDFSFAGLKTSLLYTVRDLGEAETAARRGRPRRGLRARDRHGARPAHRARAGRDRPDPPGHRRRRGRQRRAARPGPRARGRRPRPGARAVHRQRGDDRQRGPLRRRDRLPGLPRPRCLRHRRARALRRRAGGAGGPRIGLVLALMAAGIAVAALVGPLGATAARAAGAAAPARHAAAARRPQPRARRRREPERVLVKLSPPALGASPTRCRRGAKARAYLASLHAEARALRGALRARGLKLGHVVEFGRTYDGLRRHRPRRRARAPAEPRRARRAGAAPLPDRRGGPPGAGGRHAGPTARAGPAGRRRADRRRPDPLAGPPRPRRRSSASPARTRSRRRSPAAPRSRPPPTSSSPRSSAPSTPTATATRPTTSTSPSSALSSPYAGFADAPDARAARRRGRPRDARRRARGQRGRPGRLARRRAEQALTVGARPTGGLPVVSTPCGPRRARSAAPAPADRRARARDARARAALRRRGPLARPRPRRRAAPRRPRPRARPTSRPAAGGRRCSCSPIPTGRAPAPGIPAGRGVPAVVALSGPAATQALAAAPAA